MQKIIKDGGLVEDRSLMIPASVEKPFAEEPSTQKPSTKEPWPPHHEGPCFLTWPQWLNAYPDFEGFYDRPGVWIEGSDDIEAFQSYLEELPAIAIRFNSFSDGTGFSTGALLRELHGFEGELRAFGEVVADQALQLRRCGFNAIALKQGESLETALSLLLGSGLTYQGSVYSPRTPFKFRF